MGRYEDFLSGKVLKDRPTGLDNVPELDGRMFRFQMDIVSWALRRGRAAIFADCGLGKTFMQLEWARHVPGDTLILAPLAVASQTVREGAKFGITVNQCRKREGLRPGINVTNYEMLDGFDPGDFVGVVLDESSILKSYDGRTRTAIIEAFRETPFRLACTATPAPNDHMELGNHAEFLGAMTRSEMLSTFFVHDGGETQKWRLKGHAEAEFWRWVCSWAVMLRKPSDLGYQDNEFRLPELRISQYTVRVRNVPEGMLFPMPASSMQERLAARRETVLDRVEACSEMVRSRGGTWVIWCNLNDEGDLLERSIPDSAQIKGSDSAEEKERILTEFSAMRIPVLITKASMTGFGMNWQHCSRMAFVGLNDSYEQFYQAIRRCWRFGQESPVEVHVFSADTEGAVVENIRRKEADAERMAKMMAENMRGINMAEIRGSAGRNIAEYRTAVERGTGWELRLGDCVETAKELPDDSVDYSIYSPPFASLYTYSASDRDMGNCRSNSDFLEHYKFLIRELFRATKPGRLTSFHCMNLPTSKANHGYIGIRDFRGALIRVHEEVGWIFHSEVCIWKDPVTAMQRTKALGLLHKQLKKDSCMSRQGIPDYLVTMRKPGENSSPVRHDNVSFPVSEWQNIASPVWTSINPNDTLQHRSAREHKDERHICPLQLEVIRRGIRLWSNIGDLVFSPFAGIGSEGYIALQMGRRFLGTELKHSYWDQARKNLANAKAEMSLLGGEDDKQGDSRQHSQE